MEYGTGITASEMKGQAKEFSNPSRDSAFYNTVGTTPTVKEKEGDVCNGEGEVCKEQGAVCKEKELEGAKEMNKKKIKENRDQNPNRC